MHGRIILFVASLALPIIAAPVLVSEVSLPIESTVDRRGDLSLSRIVSDVLKRMPHFEVSSAEASSDTIEAKREEYSFDETNEDKQEEEEEEEGEELISSNSLEETPEKRGRLDGNGHKSKRGRLDGNGHKSKRGRLDGNGHKSRRGRLDGNGHKSRRGRLDGNGHKSRRGRLDGNGHRNILDIVKRVMGTPFI